MTRGTGWFKSSYSAGSNNSCVEVRLTEVEVGVRDSKNPHGARLAIGPGAWAALVRGLKG